MLAGDDPLVRSAERNLAEVRTRPTAKVER
jgi:hypothetical protein